MGVEFPDPCGCGLTRVTDNDVDLGSYAETFAVYQTRIAKSLFHASWRPNEGLFACYQT